MFILVKLHKGTPLCVICGMFTDIRDPDLVDVVGP